MCGIAEKNEERFLGNSQYFDKAALRELVHRGGRGWRRGEPAMTQWREVGREGEEAIEALNSSTGSRQVIGALIH